MLFCLQLGCPLQRSCGHEEYAIIWRKHYHNSKAIAPQGGSGKIRAGRRIWQEAAYSYTVMY
ncbi:MAG: hypothetical protein GX795_07620 [Firmicutes bacterium]|nr:hypothetical protein [Bacillota bacterium]